MLQRFPSIGWATILIASLALFSWLSATAQTSKISGVSIVTPIGAHQDWTPAVKQLGAGWVAVMPYALGQMGQSQLVFDVAHKFLPRFEAYRKQIHEARDHGLKVMIKPMIWVMGSWAGGFELATEASWKEWEQRYRVYILQLADIAELEGVELFCIGTELSMVQRKRPQFLKSLIEDVKLHYHGKLTYAANWDDFLTVSIWDKVDYIGIDAYFPLIESKSPTVEALKAAWLKHLRHLRPLYLTYKKPILFTEFGYRSIDECCWEQWKRESLPHDASVNLEGQNNAYQAFFEVFWGQPWFAGVFLWQWYPDDAKAGGKANSDFTPQNKPAERTISKWFAQ